MQHSRGTIRTVAEVLVALAALGVLTAGVLARSSVAQDLAVRDAAVAGYEEDSQHLDALVRVRRLDREGDCAVVEVEGGISGHVSVRLLRRGGAWIYDGSIAGRPEDARDERRCRDLPRAATFDSP